MTTKTTTIVASVLIIALASSAIIGVTYSWFSDQDDVGIHFTPGKIGISTEISDMKAKNYGYDFVPASEGIIKLDSGAEIRLEKSDNKYSINFDKAAPGDLLKFNLKIHNDSTIKAKWAVFAEGVNEDIFDVSIKCGDAPCDKYVDFGDEDEILVNVEISIKTSVESVTGVQDMIISAKATQSTNPDVQPVVANEESVAIHADNVVRERSVMENDVAIPIAGILGTRPITPIV